MINGRCTYVRIVVKGGERKSFGMFISSSAFIEIVKIQKKIGKLNAISVTCVSDQTAFYAWIRIQYGPICV
jgi:hypothetical protein